MNRILLVSSRGEEDLLNHYWAVFYLNASKALEMENENFSTLGTLKWDFAVIDPGSQYLTSLSKYLGAGDMTTIAIANHSNENALPRIIIIVGLVDRIKGFSHDSHCSLWTDKIEPLLQYIRNGIGDYSALHQSLWKALVPSPLEEADKLRAEILTPLVGLDWLTQSNKLTDPIKDQIIVEMNSADYKNKIKRFDEIFDPKKVVCWNNIKNMIKSKNVHFKEFDAAAKLLDKEIQNPEKVNS